MKPDLLRTLLAADHAVQCESPPGFDRDEELAQVRALAPLLEAVTGRPFVVDDSVQDASFFADLATHEDRPRRGGGILRHTILAARFSAFGRLFTVWSVCRPGTELAPTIVERVIQAVSEHGYVYVAADALEEPYGGSNPQLRGVSWWIRYFDYL